MQCNTGAGCVTFRALYWEIEPPSSSLRKKKHLLYWNHAKLVGTSQTSDIISSAFTSTTMEVGRETKRRKKVSEAERLALELSKAACDLYKINPDHSHQNHVRFFGNGAIFPNSGWLNCNSPRCNLTKVGQQISYCSQAEFR